MCNLKPNFSPQLNAEIYTKHPILHTRCKIGRISFRLLILSVYCGAGGSRTNLNILFYINKLCSIQISYPMKSPTNPYIHCVKTFCSAKV